MAVTFTKDQVLAAYNDAPDLVRNTFNGDDATKVIADIQAKYSLHLDVAGEIGKEMRYMLLGLMNPTEFYGSLVASGIEVASANAIVGEINQKVFVPLQQEMRKNGAMQGVTPSAPSADPFQATQPKPSAPSVPVSAPTTVAPKPVTPTPAPKPVAAPAAAIRPTEMPAAPQLPQAPWTPSPAPISLSVPAALNPTPDKVTEAPTELPAIRTMAKDIQALKHPEASPYPAPAHSTSMWPAPTASAYPSSPARSFQTASVPSTAPQALAQPTSYAIPHPAPAAPSPTPAVAHPTQTPTYPGQAATPPSYIVPERPVAASVPVTPAPAPVPPMPQTPPVVRPQAPSGAPQPLIKEYGVDPYRESIA